MNLKNVFPDRKKDSHKKDYGHLLIAAGSDGFAGAGALAALGALKSGAGLVTLAVPKRIQNVCASFSPDIMTLGLGSLNSGSVKKNSAQILLDFALRRGVDFIVCGCGLGVSKEAHGFVSALAAGFKGGLLLDADALNNIAFYGGGKDIFNRAGGLILTPHPGEMARLTGLVVSEVQSNRVKIAGQFALKNNLICVLKGSGSVVTDGRKVYVNNTGNAGMAKAGSGDVLSGIIGAVGSRRKNYFEASKCGVFLHGLAGDIARVNKNSYSMTASDIIESLPEALKSAGVR